MISETGLESLNIRTISLPDFAVSWAGDSPGRPGYWFGSDDGRIQFMSSQGHDLVGPYAIAPSEEAVNGIAFAGNLMAVSTRSDVSFLRTPTTDESRIERSVFQGGAHGVANTRDGSIIAPLGRRGILLMSPQRDSVQSVRILKPADQTFYLYKVISLASPERGTILACAGRRGGFTTMPLAGPGLQTYGKKLRPAGVDFVDVAALDVGGFPFAVAALGLDRSIHFVTDLLVERSTTTLHLDPETETAYRILCAEGHVFMLTDKRLYAYKDLAARFLRGEKIENPVARCLELEAVDAALGPDRSLLLVMPESVYEIRFDAIFSGADAWAGRPGNAMRTHLHVQTLAADSDEETWESFEDAWEQSQQFELMEVG